MKMNTTLKTGLVVFAGCFSLAANAQQKPAELKKFGKSILNTESHFCGSTEYESHLQLQNPKRKNNSQFENWIAPKVAEAKAKRLQKNGQGTNEAVTIPVVFHIIHNGSPVGTAENIADAQIISQITVLNQDFRRMEGTNGFNTNPVGADTEINFCLAQRDPNGLASNGITRHALGNGEGWEMSAAEIIKAQTQWDPEKYLNIWVFDQIYGLAGYAQFPTASGLDGIDIEGLTTTANTDGVALGHNYVGSKEIYPQGIYFDKKDLGRTASHEVGHFFGLRHIWGDKNNTCTGEDDYCNDTPVAARANTGCVVGTDSCPAPGLDMIENYMDYTDDSCLNIFTQNQKDRMVAVLANSPRRHSLITSDGCTPGVVFDNDGSLELNGFNTTCGVTTLNPKITITNSGHNTLTSATLTYHLDDQEATTYNWTGNLVAGTSEIINLPALTSTAGNHTFYADILTVNGGEDQAPTNDIKSINFTLTGTYATNQVIVKIQTDDFGDETYWIIGDEDGNELAGGNIDEFGQPTEIYESNQLYTIPVTLNQNGCYMFMILDSGQNGICCTEGNGYYKIETPDGQLITEGSTFGLMETKSFAIDNTTGVENITKSENNIKIYPNPANNILNITTSDNDMPEGYIIYNSLGQVMDRGAITTTTQSLNIAGYANGIYFIKLAKGEQSKTLQFIKY